MSVLTLPISWLARLTIALMGWTLVPPPRDRPAKFVAIIGHHTSHWDLVLALLAFWSYRIPFRVLVKKEVFEVPVIGRIVKMLGGHPVDRENPRQSGVDLARALKTESWSALAMAPSATRSKRTGWKMGFYVIARRARCPLMLAYMDWRKREVSIGVPMPLSGDVDRDMDKIRAFYADKAARFPDLVTPIRPLDDRRRVRAPTASQSQQATVRNPPIGPLAPAGLQQRPARGQ